MLCWSWLAGLGFRLWLGFMSALWSEGYLGSAQVMAKEKYMSVHDNCRECALSWNTVHFCNCFFLFRAFIK